MAKAARDWEEEDRELRADYVEARAELKDARTTRQRKAKEKAEAAEALERAEEAYREFGPPALDPRWAHFWLALIGLGEFVLNATVFEVLGSGRWETYLAALAVGAAVPLLAHLTGRKLRQREKSRTDRALLWVAPMGLLLGLSGVSYLRGLFAEARGEEIERVFGVELSGAAFTLVFFGLNAMLFVAAVLLVYAGSHRDPQGYKRAREDYEAAREQLQEKSEEAAATAERLQRARKERERARVRREKRYRRYRQEALKVLAAAELLTRVYREANVRARPGGRPACFDRQAPASSLELPEALRDEKLTDWEGPEAPAQLEGVSEPAVRATDRRALEELA